MQCLLIATIAARSFGQISIAQADYSRLSRSSQLVVSEDASGIGSLDHFEFRFVSLLNTQDSWSAKVSYFASADGSPVITFDSKASGMNVGASQWRPIQPSIQLFGINDTNSAYFTTEWQNHSRDGKQRIENTVGVFRLVRPGETKLKTISWVQTNSSNSIFCQLAPRSNRIEAVLWPHFNGQTTTNMELQPNETELAKTKSASIKFSFPLVEKSPVTKKVAPVFRPLAYRSGAIYATKLQAPLGNLWILGIHDRKQSKVKLPPNIGFSTSSNVQLYGRWLRIGFKQDGQMVRKYLCGNKKFFEVDWIAQSSSGNAVFAGIDGKITRLKRTDLPD